MIEDIFGMIEIVLFALYGALGPGIALKAWTAALAIVGFHCTLLWGGSVLVDWLAAHAWRLIAGRRA